MTDDKSGTVRIVAATVDKKQAVLYKEDGGTITLHNTDHRLADLMDEIIPITSRGEVAVVNLSEFSVYRDFERKSGGVVRFFKTARKVLDALTGDRASETVILNMEFSTDITPPQMTGLLNQVEEHLMPFINKMAQPAQTSRETEHPPVLVAVDMKVGKDQTSETIVERLEPMDQEEVTADEMVVAMVGNALIPDVDKLKDLIIHAVKTNSVEAVTNFLKKAGEVIKSRVFTVRDLMLFLEKGDLPLAQDGSIVAYKSLYRRGDGYVDCHTRKINQKIGSYVCVDEKLVDLNRHTECSNGLHIGRRSYMRGFSGDVIVLCKIEPEDVMVVPHRDPDKVRVKGYHIIAELSEEARQKVRNNQPFTTIQEAQAQLYDAITGNHIARIEEVRVHGQQGENVVVTLLLENQNQPKPEPKELDHKSRRKATAVDDTSGARAIQPREINERLKQERERAASNTTVNVEDEAGVRQVDAPKAPKAKKPAIKKHLKKVLKPLKTNGKKAPETPKGKSQKPGKKVAKAAVTETPVENTDLSAEQKRVLSLVKQGVSQSEIARKTGVSRRTIDRWFKKYGTDIG